MKNISYDLRDQGIVHVYLDAENTSANVINASWVEELNEILTEIRGLKQEVNGLIFFSRKEKIFVAGADIQEIKKISDPQQAFEVARRGQILMQNIEDLPFPTVAAINGTCVGGGLELALACTYLIGSEQAQVALPEVKLGLIPGWGGTQRLPRRTGLIKAIELISTGKMLDARRAEKYGILDGVTRDSDLERLAMGFIQKTYRKRAQKTTLSNVIENNGFLRARLIIPKARRSILAQTKGRYPAPLAALHVLEKTYGRSHPHNYEIEAQKLAETLTSETCKNLVALFLSMEGARKKVFDKNASEIKTVGVLGAGIMGGGIAHAFIKKDIPTFVKDLSSEAVAKAFHIVCRLIDKEAQKKKWHPSMVEQKRLLFSPVQATGDFKNKDLIVEAVLEDINVKKSVFQDLEKKITKKTLIASNTSALSITEMGSALKYPERFLGLHFFNPVPKMPLVEIVVGEKTSEATIATAYKAMVEIGKTPILVKDRPGFLVNRILVLYLLEALRMLEEGGQIDRIDHTIKKFGFPMGPFELIDEVGIDVASKVGYFLCDAFDYFPEAPQALARFVDNKLLGKKSGRGFYLHDSKKRPPNQTFLEKSIPQYGRNNFSPDEIELRLTYLFLNECQRCLDEKVVETEAEVDLAMILGTGFPPFRGGPMRLKHKIGGKKLRETLESLQGKYGPHFAPAKGV